MLIMITVMVMISYHVQGNTDFGLNGMSLPSPGYVARGGVRGPQMETCPHCYRQILAICLAAHF